MLSTLKMEKLSFTHHKLSNEISEDVKKLPIILTLQVTFIYFWMKYSSDKLTGNNDFFAILSKNFHAINENSFFLFFLGTAISWCFSYSLSKHCRSIERMREKNYKIEQKMKLEISSLKLDFISKKKYQTRYEFLIEGCSIMTTWIYLGIPALYHTLILVIELI